MKLRYSPASPYVRKCLVLAHEAGLAGRIHVVPTVTADPASGLANDNPLGKIPALIVKDGQVLFDSPVICEYLDSLHGGAGILPPAGPARWTALRREALADGILDAAILRLLEGRRPANEQSPGWVEKQKAVIARALDAFEAEAGQLGDPAAVPTTIGHITLGCALGYLDFRFGVDEWRRTRPKLARWFEGFAARPSMAATVPKDPA
ncbi:MAG: glutathione S-transferase N-terminal domain-containing protein [Dongiaceae bacterium]